jgi:hypothetical protein
MKKIILLALLGALHRPGLAYVTSATFEYSVDDHARMYLNGKLVSNELGFHFPDYAVLSTSDGSLPLEDFVLNGENVLAVEDLDTTGGDIAISYRLTVHHSNGDPVVLWSVPEGSKILHLSKDDPEPAGWMDPSFNDSAWGQALKIVYGDQWFTYPEIQDRAFGGIFQGVVPHLSHIGNGHSSPGDKNLFRNRFSFPYSPAKTRLFLNPPAARQGQAVALRLMPGGDAADIGAFRLYADLPPGLDLISAPGAAVYDREKRRVGWSYPGGSASVRYVSLTAASVISASGWIVPEKVLGGAKPDHPTGWNHPNIPDDRYLDAAAFFPGAPAWFKLQAPDPSLAKAYPIILGVIFHSQLCSGGQNTAYVKDVDDILFNYAVGPEGKALKKDVWVSRVSNSNAWYDGYYDATEDRKWTWEDIQNLKVVYEAQTRRNPDKNLMAATWVVVKCFRPQDSAPVFYAKVSAAQCQKLEVQAGIYSPRFAGAAADAVLLPVNQEACPSPTPVPTVSLAIAAGPTPSPVAVSKIGAGLELLGLGCLSSSPEPFNYAGVFVRFCLKRPAQVLLRVYRSGGTVLSEVPGGDFRAGDGQIFFNAQDSQGNPLGAGTYTYELLASDGEVKAVRQGSFTRAPDKR